MLLPDPCTLTHSHADIKSLQHLLPTLTTGPSNLCEPQWPVHPKSQGLIPRVGHNRDCCCLQPCSPETLISHPFPGGPSLECPGSTAGSDLGHLQPSIFPAFWFSVQLWAPTCLWSLPHCLIPRLQVLAIPSQICPDALWAQNKAWFYSYFWCRE